MSPHLPRFNTCRVSVILSAFCPWGLQEEDSSCVTSVLDLSVSPDIYTHLCVCECITFRSLCCLAQMTLGNCSLSGGLSLHITVTKGKGATYRTYLSLLYPFNDHYEWFILCCRLSMCRHVKVIGEWTELVWHHHDWVWILHTANNVTFSIISKTVLYGVECLHVLQQWLMMKWLIYTSLVFCYLFIYSKNLPWLCKTVSRKIYFI